MIYESFIRPLLFALDPESAHELAVSLLERAGRSAFLRSALERSLCFEDPSLESRVAGIRFPNPVGLGAGFDKDCRLAGVMPSFGFGFVECGTVTPLPQTGNPRPRVLRVPQALALINRLGFNNRGAEAAAGRLRTSARGRAPVGINIGRGRDTPPERAPEDYRRAFEALAPYADYAVVNVSSPNTPGLRELQGKERLKSVLAAVRAANTGRKPVFVKLSPDLSDEQLDELLPVMAESADGAVVSNTTVSRDGLPERWARVEGGLSGAPLKARSTRLVAEVFRKTRGRLPIIGAGGVFSAEDAFEKIRAGASLVQVYTGFIYRGPGLVREMLEGLARLVSERGLKSVSEAVGLDHRSAAAKG